MRYKIQLLSVIKREHIVFLDVLQSEASAAATSRTIQNSQAPNVTRAARRFNDPNAPIEIRRQQDPLDILYCNICTVAVCISRELESETGYTQ
jgi:hypothetical protein